MDATDFYISFVYLILQCQIHYLVHAIDSYSLNEVDII